MAMAQKARIASRRRYYTPGDVAAHNSATDCLVSIFHRVFDLTDLIRDNQGPLAQPLIEVAGQDISHWFTNNPVQCKTYIDPDRGMRLPYTPHGRFIDVPPSEPTASWSTSFGIPWWQNEDIIVGRLSEKTRKIMIVNVLTQQKDVLEVCSEETMLEIRDRYMEYNKHAESYTWKKLHEGKFVVMNMQKTLDENGVIDESDDFEELGIDEDFYYPIIHVYFEDNLTIA